MYYKGFKNYIECIIINKKEGVLFMNTVQPIRDLAKLEALKEELKRKGTRDVMLFYTGLNSRNESV